MRILYLGLPLGALCLLREGYPLTAACISRPDAPGMRRLRRVLRAPLHERPDLNDRALRASLAEGAPELIVSWFWTKRVPRSLLALAPRGGVNVHPSLLPRHRGADPYFWTLRRRDAQTGVTVHRLDDQYDTGPILLQRSVPVPPGVDAWRLAKSLDLPTLQALHEVLDGMRRGEALSARAQDESLATHAPAPTDDDCELRWTEPAEDVLALVRAAGPEPGAFTASGDATVVVLAAEVVDAPAKALRPGEAVLTERGVVVTCGDGRGLRVLRARDEADDATLVGREVARLFPGIAEVRG